jgi:hypothetical protein
LIQTPTGNLPWDCVGLIDDPTVARIEEQVHIAEIAISHPHYDTSLVEWSRAFDKGIIPSGGKEVVRPTPRTIPQGGPRLRRNVLAGSQSGRGWSRLPFASSPIAGKIPPDAGSCR